MTKTLPLVSLIVAGVVLSGCSAPNAPAGSGPIANPLAASCVAFPVKDTSVVNADGSVPTDAPTAVWPTSGSSALADELGLQDVINGSCYYDNKDNPFPDPAFADREGGFFFRADPDEGDVAAYIEKMSAALTDKGYEVQVEDTGFEANLDQVEVGAYFFDELTEDMFATGSNIYTELGLEPGDSMLYGAITRYAD